MILNFRHINGKSFILDMNDDATIQQTKIALAYLYKLPYQSLEFLLNGRKLNDEEFVSKIGYTDNDCITFYEPIPSDDLEGISPFFGSIPQVCNSVGAPPFNDKNTFKKNAPPKNQEKINPFKDIENGSDMKYLKYVIEPSLVQDPTDSSFNFAPISIDGNEIKYNTSKKPSKFEKAYKNDIDTLTKPVYPQNEIIQKAQTSVEYFYADIMQQARLNRNSSHQNQSKSYMNTSNTLPQNPNPQTFATNNNDGSLPTYNLNNMNNFSYTGTFNNNVINSTPPSQVNTHYFQTINFNYPMYGSQSFQQYPFR